MSSASKSKVFVTRNIPDAGLDLVRAACDANVWTEPLPPSRDVLLEKIAGCDGGLSLLTEQVDAEFFGDNPRHRSNFICAIGYGDRTSIFARSPRPEFDKFNRIA